jgi:hypothetical protein
VLSPPDDLAPEELAAAVARGWALTVSTMAYRAVGFGSHHWEVTDATGGRWFVTADDLEIKRHSRSELLEQVFGRLRRALAAAVDLRAGGNTSVLAPVPARDGQPLARVGPETGGGRFAVAVYPFAAGQSFEWGEFSGPEHRRAMLDLIVAVHTAPGTAGRRALADDFAVPHRDELEAALHSPAGGDEAADGDERTDSADILGDGNGAGSGAACGPYARAAARLIAEHAGPLRRLLARYDELVALAGSQSARMVLTDGEPHPGNTMLTSAGWLLIDWDTALRAPPERDLWSLDPGDGSLLAAYADATGVTPLPAVLDLYRIRWDLADIAADVSRFRRYHQGDLDDDESFALLRALVSGLGA